MKDRDHNEAMAGLFQADPRFAADYLRQVLADGEPADVRAGLRQMANVLRVSQVAAPTDFAPSAGLFDRAGVRYEVACDVIGALIAHYAEIMGREREQAQPNEAVLRVAGAMKAALAGERDDLDPRDSAGIEAAISRYAPLARRLYGQDENDHARQEQRRADFDQANASLALEGLAMSADDLAVQALLIRGDITHDEAVQCYRILHRLRSKADWPPEVAGVLDLLESQPPDVAGLVGCFLAAVARPDHAAELAMFDKLPPAARMAVGRFFSFFLAGGLGGAEREKLHLHIQAWFVRQRRFP